LGISFDPPDKNKTFATAQGFPFPLLSDTDRSVGEAYGTKRPPDHERAASPRRLTFLIDPEGKVAKVYNVRDLGAHPDEVLQDLKQTQPAS
jgi:peroxiredoxin Q/BCP